MDNLQIDKQISTINSALKALSLLRSSTLDTLKYLANTFHSSRDPEFDLETNTTNNNNNKNNSSYINDLSSLSSILETRVRELETACTLLYPFVNNLKLDNTELIAQDPNYERTSLYNHMVISYRWLDNTQEYSNLAFQALQTRFIKRNSRYRQRTANRMPTNIHMTTPVTEAFIAQLHRLTDTMSIEVVRPFGVFSVLKIVLDRTLRAVIVLRGLVIEWVLVKSFEESFEKLNTSNVSKMDRRYQYPSSLNDLLQDESMMDIWKPSRYKIFRTITDHANAALLHFYAPIQMESAIKAYMIWFRSYSNLFSAICRKCNSRLLNDMPPTWRDFRTNDPYHFECRP